MKNSFINSMLLATTGVEAVYHASKEKFHRHYDMSARNFYPFEQP